MAASKQKAIIEQQTAASAFGYVKMYIFKRDRLPNRPPRVSYRFLRKISLPKPEHPTSA